MLTLLHAWQGMGTESDAVMCTGGGSGSTCGDLRNFGGYTNVLNVNDGPNKIHSACDCQKACQNGPSCNTW